MHMHQADIDDLNYADALYFIEKHHKIEKNKAETEKNKLIWQAYIQCNPREVVSQLKNKGKTAPELSKLQALKAKMGASRHVL